MMRRMTFVVVVALALHWSSAAAAQPAAPATPAATPATPAATPATPAADSECKDPLAPLQEVDTRMRRAEGLLELYQVSATCRAVDPAAADPIKNEWQDLQGAFDRTNCARQSADKGTRKRGQDTHKAISQLSYRLLLAGAQASVENNRREAQRALVDAQKAKNVDDAKVAAKVASDQAKAAREAGSPSGDPCTSKAVAAVEAIATAAQEQVELRESAPSTMCGAGDLGLPKQYCGIYGISAAALSYLWTANGDGVSAGRRLASVGVPAVAFRWPWTSWLAVDVGGYSAFITKSLESTTPSVGKVPCSKSPTDYETKLPCEATNEMYAYLGVYGGLTMGREGVGFLTLSPLTFGIAQVGSRSTLVPYLGLSVGVLQVNGTF